MGIWCVSDMRSESGEVQIPALAIPPDVSPSAMSTIIP